MLVGISVAQVFIPTGVSTQSGIVRNVPTQIVRIPADTYINDGRQTYLAAQVPLQFFNTNNRGTNNNNNNNLYTTATGTNTHNNRQFQTLNVREENLRRLIESEARLRDLLLLADQDNDNNNNNYNTNYNTNNKNNNNNRFTTTGTFGTTQTTDQYNDNTNDNTNFNRNTHPGTLLTRGQQLRTLISSTNRDTSDLTQQYRTNTDTTTGLHRLRDTTLLGRL